jgi:hypothetical protein
MSANNEQTYYGLFYENVQKVADRFDVLLSQDERAKLRDEKVIRDLFAKLPLYVSAVDGLMEALNEQDRQQRTRLLTKILAEHNGVVASYIPNLNERLEQLEQVDRDRLAAGFAALYYLATSAQTSTP